MAKNFGKFILFTAAVGTACAAAYYYMQKKDNAFAVSYDDDEDYDDFEDLTAEKESSRNYVPLSHDTAPAAENSPLKEAAADLVDDVARAAEGAAETAEDTFTSLKDSVRDITEDAVHKMDETVEEFFDEEDAADEEPPIQDEN